MRMLEKDEEEADIQVSWQDQQNINEFSKFNAKLQLLEESYDSKKTEKEYLDDLTAELEELELTDEEALVKYRIGEAFVSLTLEAAQERNTKAKEELDEELAQIKGQMDEAIEKMDALKKVLYARFGNAINLEKD
ncbi:hypothetical protein BGZ83_004861 [Gryganskiella cystojenkinii]|nr:hypothetical protein BGZ83_004861 [Gryganskiella cystojenkinii]